MQHDNPTVAAATSITSPLPEIIPELAVGFEPGVTPEIKPEARLKRANDTLRGEWSKLSIEMFANCDSADFPIYCNDGYVCINKLVGVMAFGRIEEHLKKYPTCKYAIANVDSVHMLIAIALLHSRTSKGFEEVCRKFDPVVVSGFARVLVLLDYKESIDNIAMQLPAPYSLATSLQRRPLLSSLWFGPDPNNITINDALTCINILLSARGKITGLNKHIPARLVRLVDIAAVKKSVNNWRAYGDVAAIISNLGPVSQLESDIIMNLIPLAWHGHMSKLITISCIIPNNGTFMGPGFQVPQSLPKRQLPILPPQVQAQPAQMQHPRPLSVLPLRVPPAQVPFRNQQPQRQIQPVHTQSVQAQTVPQYQNEKKLVWTNMVPLNPPPVVKTEDIKIILSDSDTESDEDVRRQIQTKLRERARRRTAKAIGMRVKKTGREPKPGIRRKSQAPIKLEP